ncbi:MAG TPA: VCBS repeat-containing protein [Planctomycetes bacterium]|nr:VCBS repeat-containing protein [Planctomycetota bacterium]
MGRGPQHPTRHGDPRGRRRHPLPSRRGRLRRASRLHLAALAQLRRFLRHPPCRLRAHAPHQRLHPPSERHVRLRHHDQFAGVQGGQLSRGRGPSRVQRLGRHQLEPPRGIRLHGARLHRLHLAPHHVHLLHRIRRRLALRLQRPLQRGLQCPLPDPHSFWDTTEPSPPPIHQPLGLRRPPSLARNAQPHGRPHQHRLLLAPSRATVVRVRSNDDASSHESRRLFPAQDVGRGRFKPIPPHRGPRHHDQLGCLGHDDSALGASPHLSRRPQEGCAMMILLDFNVGCRRSLQLVLMSLAFLGLLCRLGEAQLPLRSQFLGSTAGAGTGMHARRGGDVDADGFPDFLIGADHDSTLGPGAGSIRVFSGRDGSLIALFGPPNPVLGEFLGRAVANAGDVDQDGHDDVVAYALGINGGSLLLFSGAAGNILVATSNLGFLTPGNYVLDTVKDINGDGVRDVIFLSQNPWMLRTFSGSDLSLLLQIDLSTTGFFPQIVRNAGDVNGDGIDDLILGARFYPYTTNTQFPNGPPNTGAVRVISSLDGSLIHTLQGPPPTTSPFGFLIFSEFGASVDGLGDLDGDGFDDFAIGAPGDGLGSIRIHSGFNGSQMGVLSGNSGPNDFGLVLSGCGDVNGDGVPDLASAAFDWPGLPPVPTNAGHLLVFSGVDFSLLFEAHGDQPNQVVGALVMGLGDLNGDGFPEIGCSIADSSIAINNGGVRVYSFGGTRRYGENLGSLQTLNQTWFPAVAGDPAQGAIVCSGGAPGGLGFFGLSLETANTSVMGIPVVIDDTPAELILTQPFYFDGQGKYAALAPIRYPGLGGLLVRSQFFSLTSPFASSNGLEFLLLP